MRRPTVGCLDSTRARSFTLAALTAWPLLRRLPNPGDPVSGEFPASVRSSQHQFAAPAAPAGAVTSSRNRVAAHADHQCRDCKGAGSRRSSLDASSNRRMSRFDTGPLVSTRGTGSLAAPPTLAEPRRPGFRGVRSVSSQPRPHPLVRSQAAEPASRLMPTIRAATVKERAGAGVVSMRRATVGCLDPTRARSSTLAALTAWPAPPTLAEPRRPGFRGVRSVSSQPSGGGGKSGGDLGQHAGV